LSAMTRKFQRSGLSLCNASGGIGDEEVVCSVVKSRNGIKTLFLSKIKKNKKIKIKNKLK